jgi:4-hydroxy-2-oxoheptanedioate aldolase
MINNAAQAKEAISLAKFPPRGVRGQGGPFACYEFGFATPAEYVAAANDLVMTMVQIETIEGLQNVDEICQTEGVGECDIRDAPSHMASCSDFI